MIDLDAKIRSLVERNVPRKDIMRELDAIASAAEKRARRFERARKGERYRAADERALSARVGRLLFFLHHGVPAQGATDADHKIYALLKALGASACSASAKQ